MNQILTKIVFTSKQVYATHNTSVSRAARASESLDLEIRFKIQSLL
jgi:hypothetical protein